MNHRFPMLGLLTIALLCFPGWVQVGITQTAPTPASSQPAIDRDRRTEADRLLQQGEQQLQTSQFQLALASFEQALRLYRETDDRAGEGATLNSLGSVYSNLGEYAQAREYYGV